MYPLVLVVAMKDPIPLRHFGKKEILAKIDLMEDQFDVPMTFNKSQISAHISLMAAGEEVRAWNYGLLVYGAAWGHRREVATPSLMADMFGFVSEEEMDDTKSYLQSHGNYQLEQVRVDKRVSI